MNYSNINVNSAEYSRLPRLEQIKVINSKLESLFTRGEKNSLIVIYKGEKKSIPSNKFGEYKDLCEREKKLKKPFSYNIDYLLDDSSNDEGEKILSHASEFFIVPSSSTLIDKDAPNEMAKKGTSGFVAPDNDMFVVEVNIPDKKNGFKVPSVDDLTKKSVTEMETKKDTGFKVPSVDDLTRKSIEEIGPKKEINRAPKGFIEMLEEINVEMSENSDNIEIRMDNNTLPDDFYKKQVPVPETIIVSKDSKEENDNTIDNVGISQTKEENNDVNVDDEDYTAVWENAFRKRNLVLGRKEKAVVLGTKSKMVDKNYQNYKNGEDDDDLSLFWGPVFDNQNRKNDSDNEDAFEAEIINDIAESVDEEKSSKKGLFAAILAIPFIKKEENNRKKSVIISKNGKYEKRNKKGLFAAILAIPFIKKIRDNKKIILNPIEDRTNKRRNLKIAAVAIALAVTTVICSFIPGLSKKKNRGIVKGKTSESIVYENPSVVEPPVEDIVIDNSDKGNEYNSDNKEVETNDNIMFDDKVTIEDNSYIYYSSYDAASENNYLTPLYNGSYERDIMGIVYSLEGKIYTIYSSDPDAYMKAEELIEQGAKEEAVLVTRTDLVYTGQYEGYYNIDDVKVLTRVR